MVETAKKKKSILKPIDRDNLNSQRFYQEYQKKVSVNW